MNQLVIDALPKVSFDILSFDAISIFSQFSFNWFILDTSFEGWFGEKKKNEFINLSIDWLFFWKEENSSNILFVISSIMIIL